ncbi:MAG: undecaprenyl-diphosphate phosphatase [Nocardiopsaceae bacterium]|jgi:undecaprenyl-diphosphatase|nr:undecaprenyl-diphosphate phosphatase [Nocardiopsaceae bacterium]
MTHLTYLEAAVVGLVQGVSELFPVSSLGHNVLIPAIIGGSWAKDLNVAAPESPYLAFIVGLHVATAIALLIYFWRDWIRIIGGFFTSLGQFAVPAPGTRRFSLTDPNQRLAWMVILATIPVGLVGLVAEHQFRVIFGHPIYAAGFLVINGLILIAGEKFRRRKSLAADEEIAAAQRTQRARSLSAAARPGAGQPGMGQPGAARAGAGPPGAGPPDAGPPGTGRPGAGRHAASQPVIRNEEVALAIESDQRLSRVGYIEAVIIGLAQILALLAGISRDGVTMVAGMVRGLSREDAARFAFLLATPVILAAGVLKIPDLFGPLGKGIHGPILLGSILSGIGAYLSVRFLVRYFRTRTLTPFGIYCLVVGFASLVYLGLIK